MIVDTDTASDDAVALIRVLTRGMTVVDQLDAVPRGLGDTAGWPTEATGGDPHVSVCWEIDVARFKERLFRALA